MNPFRPLSLSAIVLLASCAWSNAANKSTAAAKSDVLTSVRPPDVFHRFADVDGTRIFYRETGPQNAPTILLLHGFPSSSHQFRRLMDTLGNDFHLVAPDYPGFGFSDAPASDTVGGTFSYTFEHLADVMEAFCQQKQLNRFYVYMFDFGAPVGFRLALRHPEWIQGIISQNGNAYEEGLGERVRAEISLPHEKAVASRRARLTLEGTKHQHLDGSLHPEKIPPEAWLLDQTFLDKPGRVDVMLALVENYKTNVAAYPSWHQWLRDHQPPVLLVWGKNDPIFVAAGAQAYLKDVPKAELHLLDGGHFALEEYPAQIASLIRDFIRRQTP